MLRWIYFEIKQLLFNRKNILFFLILLLTHVLVLAYFSTDDDILTNKIVEHTRNVEVNVEHLQYYSGKELKLQQELIELHQNLLDAILNNDHKEYNKLVLIQRLKDVNSIERYLLKIENPDHGSLKEKIDSYYHNHDLHLDLKEKIYQEFGFKDDNTDLGYDLSIYNSKVSHLLYNYEVYKKGFTLYDQPSRDSATITLTLFRQYLIFLVVLIPLIIGFDAFAKDKKDGSLRAIMALSQSRSQYFLVKLFSTLLVSLMFIILPLVLALLLNNVNIINDLNYPNYVYKKGLTSFEEISPVMGYKTTFLNTNDTSYRLDQYSYHSRAAFNVNEFGFVIGVNLGVELLSLGAMLGYSLILITFMILLVLSIQLSLSLNLNKAYGLLLTGFTLAILYFLSLKVNLESIESGMPMYRHVSSFINKANPMAYLNAVDVVEGTLPFTFLHGVVNLGFYSVVTNLVSIFFLKRKDITD